MFKNKVKFIGSIVLGIALTATVANLTSCYKKLPWSFKDGLAAVPIGDIPESKLDVHIGTDHIELVNTITAKKNHAYHSSFDARDEMYKIVGKKYFQFINESSNIPNIQPIGDFAAAKTNLYDSIVPYTNFNYENLADADCYNDVTNLKGIKNELEANVNENGLKYEPGGKILRPFHPSKDVDLNGQFGDYNGFSNGAFNGITDEKNVWLDWRKFTIQNQYQNADGNLEYSVYPHEDEKYKDTIIDGSYDYFLEFKKNFILIYYPLAKQSFKYQVSWYDEVAGESKNFELILSVIINVN